MPWPSDQSDFISPPRMLFTTYPPVILSPPISPLPCSAPSSLISALAILCGTVGVKPLIRFILHCATLLPPLYLHDPSSTKFSLHVSPSHILPRPLGVLVDISALASSLADQHNHSFDEILSAPPSVSSSPPHGLSSRCGGPCGRIPRRCHCRRNFIGSSRHPGRRRTVTLVRPAGGVLPNLALAILR